MPFTCGPVNARHSSSEFSDYTFHLYALLFFFFSNMCDSLILLSPANHRMTVWHNLAN